MEPAIADDVAQYRAAREYVERSVLALATSVDGVSFDFQASLHGLALRRGGYVVLESPGATRLGQVTDLRAESQTVERPHTDTVSGSSTLRVSLATGAGTVLHGSDEPFHDATVRVATPAEVGAWTAEDASDRAGLRIGELLRAPGVPLELDSGGLSRHTFMCGQSGSGKTYSLGVLLEQVLAETRLRVVVLDPNSDYVGLGDLRPGADPTAAEQYADVPAQVEVWRDTAADAAGREPRGTRCGCGSATCCRGPGRGAGARPGARPRRVRRAGGAAAPPTGRRAPPGERGRAARPTTARVPASSASVP